MQSEQIGELAKALALAQSEMKPPTKGRTAKIDSTKGGYSYKYADLADVIECYKAPLAKNGLAIAQTMRPQDGLIYLTTLLLHTSDQWIGSEYPIPSYSRPQEQGSAITYARRYAVTALLGICAEDDDDGATAQAAEPRQHYEAKQDQEPSAPVNGDAAAILDLAAELSKITGLSAPDHIKAASLFTGKDGKDMFFTDPRKQRSGKWLTGVREKLERELHKSGALAAVGNDEIPF